MIERRANRSLRFVHILGQLPGFSPPAKLDGLKGSALAVLENAYQLDPAVALDDEGQSMSLEHGLDRVPMILAHAAKNEIGLAIAAVPEKQLGDDLVGAREVDHGHVGE